MKFDKIIMNPPFTGDEHLYLRITEKSSNYANDIVCLTPIVAYISFGANKRVSTLRNNLQQKFESFECVHSTEFGAIIGSDIYILKFRDGVNPIDLDDLFFDRYKNPKLAKIIFNKFKDYGSDLKPYFNNTKEKIKSHKYNCYMPYIRGTLKNGVICWDWTTLFAPTIKYEFEEYKGKANPDSLRSFGFDTKEECKNFVDYCDSDIVMFAIHFMKLNFHIHASNFTYVPCMPTYTKSWTDDEIAKELGLTQEEVDYIHDEMKDFGYKARKQV